MSLFNPKWKYRDSNTTKQPGYLQRRMEIYRRRERMRAAVARRNAREVEQKVSVIKPKKARTA